ncbi:hepatitis A virus cellular receptor 1-like [Corticium candelabrum]|uniref:hepatitis A virus cellular receptor 1-like n=1 Tax=Corticium candelabrum TaxID=121492 RepID=UPI002E26EE1D|nr:hepatitis A virus cellular receptor 1-like [Corticium candelabrum]
MQFQAGWTRSGLSCYLLVSTRTSWDDAETDCVSKGGHLASIASVNENSVVLSLRGTSSSDNRDAWIGLHDQVVENTFVWADGTNSTCTNWDPETNEPNDSGDCVRIRSDGKWRDHGCSSLYRYVCESNATLSTTQTPTSLSATTSASATTSIVTTVSAVTTKSATTATTSSTAMFPTSPTTAAVTTDSSTSSHPTTLSPITTQSPAASTARSTSVRTAVVLTTTAKASMQSLITKHSLSDSVSTRSTSVPTTISSPSTESDVASTQLPTEVTTLGVITTRNASVPKSVSLTTTPQASTQLPSTISTTPQSSTQLPSTISTFESVSVFVPLKPTQQHPDQSSSDVIVYSGVAAGAVALTLVVFLIIVVGIRLNRKRKGSISNCTTNVETSDYLHLNQLYGGIAARNPMFASVSTNAFHQRSGSDKMNILYESAVELERSAARESENVIYSM